MRDAIRFDLAPLGGTTVTSATLRMVQRDDFRGLQSGYEQVYAFVDDATPELDDATGGTLLGVVSAPGTVGAVVTQEATAFVAAAVADYAEGDVAVFRLQDPVTDAASGSPYSLSFSNDRTQDGDPLRLVVEAVPEPAGPGALAAAVAAIAALTRARADSRGVR